MLLGSGVLAVGYAIRMTSIASVCGPLLVFVVSLVYLRYASAGRQHNVYAIVQEGKTSFIRGNQVTHFSLLVPQEQPAFWSDTFTLRLAPLQTPIMSRSRFRRIQWLDELLNGRN